MANHFNHLIEDDNMSSSSIDRNERYDQYSTMNSPYNIDSNNNSAQVINKNIQEPKIGLKLVLKRQSDNNYQVTNTTENTSTRTRPKRAASRKVKFRFSESESENENETPERKRPRVNLIQKNPIQIKNLNTHIIKKEPIIKIADPITQPSQVKIEPLKETLIEFNSNEVIKSSLEDKLNALQTRPLVLIEHSMPLPICLVEDKTNIVCTKAVLFIHLFQTFSSPCIGCPLCKIYLSTTEFSKHIHPDDEDEEESDEESKTKTNDSDMDEEDSQSSEQKLNKQPKSYKILPYKANNDELNESDLKTWKLFGQRFSQFKKQKQNNIDYEPIDKKSQQPIVNNAPIEEESSKEIIEKLDFNDWDYVNTTNDLYVLTEQRINSDQIIYLNKDGENATIEKKKNQIIVGKEKDSDDLNLSESEMTEDEEPTEMNKIIIVEPPVKISEQKPTLKELYFNFYDNSSKEKLFYIVDNQYTIIPDSYIVYINKKREIYFQQLKLAQSAYFQKKWLNLSLDLEFNIN